MDGSNGINGMLGFSTGIDGSNGINGMDGFSGSTGVDGSIGVSGISGVSVPVCPLPCVVLSFVVLLFSVLETGVFCGVVASRFLSFSIRSSISRYIAKIFAVSSFVISFSGLIFCSLSTSTN